MLWVTFVVKMKGYFDKYWWRLLLGEPVELVALLSISLFSPVFGREKVSHVDVRGPACGVRRPCRRCEEVLQAGVRRCCCPPDSATDRTESCGRRGDRMETLEPFREATYR